MNKPLSLRKNFSWAFFGNSVFYLCQFGILVILAKFGSPQMLGTYSYAVAIAVPLTLFGKLQLQAVFITDAKNEYLFADYLAVRILTTVITVLAIMVMGAIVADSAQAAIIIIVVGVNQGFLCIREMHLSAMQKAERMDMVSISNVIQGLLSLVLLFLAIRFYQKLLLAVIGLLIARVATFILYDYPVTEKLPAAIGMGHRTPIEACQNWRGLANLMWLSLPVGITAALFSLQVNIPKYFIKYYHGEATLGYFAAMSSLLSTGHMVIGALGPSACPRLARYFIVDKTSYRILLAKLVAVGIALGLSGLLVAYFFGKLILTLFFSADYAAYYKEFNWIMLSGAIAYATAFFGYGVTAARYFRIPAVIWAIVVGVTAASCYLLVPSYSIIGAAWAMSIALVVGMVLILIVTAYILQRPDNSRLKNAC
jgi:O-antigen/teichoic acid export membrane protein